MKKILFLLSFVIFFTACSNQETTVYQHLYKVQNHQGHTVYVLGTNHQAKEIKHLDKKTEEIMDNSDILYTEIPMDLGKIQVVQQKYMFTNSANDVLNDEQMKRLEKVKENYPSFQKVDYKKINLMYLSSICEQEILSSLGYTSLGIDSYLYEHFQGDKKSLETIDFQCELLARLSKYSSEMILESIENKKESEEYCKELFETYYQGTREDMNQFVTNVYKQYQTDEKAKYYYQNLVVKRNDHMIEEIEKMFDSQEVELVAVGVMHIAGDYGIISELKNRGYIVEEVK